MRHSEPALIRFIACQAEVHMHRRRVSYRRCCTSESSGAIVVFRIFTPAVKAAYEEGVSTQYTRNDKMILK